MESWFDFKFQRNIDKMYSYDVHILHEYQKIDLWNLNWIINLSAAHRRPVHEVPRVLTWFDVISSQFQSNEVYELRILIKHVKHKIISQYSCRFNSRFVLNLRSHEHAGPGYLCREGRARHVDDLYARSFAKTKGWLTRGRWVLFRKLLVIDSYWSIVVDPNGRTCGELIRLMAAR